MGSRLQKDVNVKCEALLDAYPKHKVPLQFWRNPDKVHTRDKEIPAGGLVLVPVVPLQNVSF